MVTFKVFVKVTHRTTSSFTFHKNFSFVSDLQFKLGQNSLYLISECTATTYMDTTANKCKKCPPGTFNGNAGRKIRCSECEAGKFSAAGSATCSECEAGTYSVAGSATCSKCEAGTFSSKGSSICSDCGLGNRSVRERSGCGERSLHLFCSIQNSLSCLYKLCEEQKIMPKKIKIIDGHNFCQKVIEKKLLIETISFYEYFWEYILMNKSLVHVKICSITVFVELSPFNFNRLLIHNGVES